MKRTNRKIGLSVLTLLLLSVLLGLLTYTPSGAAQTSGALAPAGDMITPRVFHTATLLNNGQVLIAGGWERFSPPFNGLVSAELYDPHTGRFTATSNMTVGWFGATATLLPDGKVLVSSAYDARYREPGFVYGEV